MHRPAILGGVPVSAEYVRIVRPVLPTLEDLEEDVSEILSSGMVTKGKNVEAFEEKVASHLLVRNAIAVSSCTAGLMLVFRALELRGEVVVPSFTFMATVSAAVWAGLKPVFADVDVATTNLDVRAVEEGITCETSAIIAVHNFGNPADIVALQEIADRHGLKLIFDAAHGFGARYRGVPVGGYGNAEVFSLSPTKLVIAGEGGIVATNDDDLAQMIQIGREYGMRNYDSVFSGINARMPEFSALMGLHSLQMVEEAADQRNKTVDIYHQVLGKVRGISFQAIRPGDRCSYKDFSIVIDACRFGLTRDELALALKEENIDVRKYYNPPVHRQTAYLDFTTADVELPATDQLAACSLSLPIWSRMDHSVCRDICTAIVRIQEFAPEIKRALSGGTTSDARDA